MGWATGILNGRAVGYGIACTCDEVACQAEIDRGLAYRCGGSDLDGVKGCGGYFCQLHLYLSLYDLDPQMCAACCDGETPRQTGWAIQDLDEETLHRYHFDAWYHAEVYLVGQILANLAPTYRLARRVHAFTC